MVGARRRRASRGWNVCGGDAPALLQQSAVIFILHLSSSILHFSILPASSHSPPALLPPAPPPCPPGECFCQLGPNGAGKSTTINALTGVVPLSGGDALVYGQSIASAGGMDAVWPLMGVCPQFDVLWDELTGREHLQLFASIKGGCGVGVAGREGWGRRGWSKVSKGWRCWRCWRCWHVETTPLPLPPLPMAARAPSFHFDHGPSSLTCPQACRPVGARARLTSCWGRCGWGRRAACAQARTAAA